MARAAIASLECRSVNPIEFDALVRVERELLELLEARRDWADSFRPMLPETIWNSPQHSTWLEQMRIVKTSQELDEALERIEEFRILWVHLSKADVGNERLATLREWVGQGGVLWAGTDLLRRDPGAVFGFSMRRNEVSMVTWSEQIDMANREPLMRPILVAASDGKRVDYTIHLSEGQFVVSQRANERLEFEPFIFWADPPLWRVACARKAQDKGAVVFRPLYTEPASAAHWLEIRLLNVSLRANLPQQQDVKVWNPAN